MNKIAPFALFLWTLFVVNAQSYKTFDCGLFSFEYPDSFSSTEIQNSPHMVLKLVSDNHYISASYWDYKISDDVCVWDENIAEYYRNLTIPGYTLVELTKETIHLRDTLIRCLKLKKNGKIQGLDDNVRGVTYLMIYRGYLFNFTVLSSGSYSKKSPTNYPDQIMKGLKFKRGGSSSTQTKKELSNDYSDVLIGRIKELNKQFPLRVDECTTYLTVTVSGKLIMYKLSILDECEEYVDYEELKNTMCYNFSVALNKPFVQLLDDNGYTVAYMIYNEKNRLKKRIDITPKDILIHYQ